LCEENTAFFARISGENQHAVQAFLITGIPAGIFAIQVESVFLLIRNNGKFTAHEIL
jgi:hypothetical protein